MVVTEGHEHTANQGVITPHRDTNQGGGKHQTRNLYRRIAPRGPTLQRGLRRELGAFGRTTVSTLPHSDDEYREQPYNQECGNGPRNGAPTRNLLIGHAEHQPAVRVIIDAAKRGLHIKGTARFREQNTEQTALNQITHALPKANKGFGACYNLATVKGFIERTDGLWDFLQVGFQTQPFQIFGVTPPRIAFKHLLLNAFVIEGGRGEAFQTGEDEILFGLGATHDALRDAPEVTVRLEDSRQVGGSGREGHQPNEVGIQTAGARNAFEGLGACKHGHDFTADEEFGIIAERQFADHALLYGIGGELNHAAINRHLAFGARLRG